jgi:hypothetical protein
LLGAQLSNSFYRVSCNYFFFFAAAFFFAGAFFFAAAFFLVAFFID